LLKVTLPVSRLLPDAAKSLKLETGRPASSLIGHHLDCHRPADDEARRTAATNGWPYCPRFTAHDRSILHLR
jgi:hypothetical protein